MFSPALQILLSQAHIEDRHRVAAEAGVRFDPPNAAEAGGHHRGGSPPGASECLVVDELAEVRP